MTWLPCPLKLSLLCPFLFNWLQSLLSCLYYFLSCQSLIQKVLDYVYYLKAFSTLSFYNFSISGLTLRSLVHLVLGVEQGNRHGSICILLHADYQLDQYYLLKILSLYLGSAIQVLKEWNMTGKKKVRLRVTLN